MNPATKRVVRIVLLCAVVVSVAARFWLRRIGRGEAGDFCTVLTVLLIAILAFFRYSEGGK